MNQQNFFDHIENEIKKAAELVKRERYREAITILNRCLRRLEKFIEKAKGPDKLRAIALIKAVGQVQSELSEKQLDSISEDHIDEKELLDI